MIRAVAAAGAALVVCALPVGSAAAAPVPASPYVVVLQDGIAAPAASIDRLASRFGLKLRNRYGAALDGFAAELSAAQLDGLRADPDVAFLEPDAVVQAAGLAQPVAAGETVPPGIR